MGASGRQEHRGITQPQIAARKANTNVKPGSVCKIGYGVDLHLQDYRGTLWNNRRILYPLESHVNVLRDDELILHLLVRLGCSYRMWTYLSSGLVV